VAPLDGCYLKIERSLEHLHALNDARERFIKKEGQLAFRFSGKANSQRTKYVFRCEEVMNDLPLLEWGVFIGDAVHCLRSALDQMVYTLATDPTPVCACPLMTTPKDWAIEAPGMLWSVPDEIQAVIEAYQPYHAGDQAHSHPLALLKALSNLDKHRGIPITALSSTEATGSIDRTVGVKSYKKLSFKVGVPLEPDAVIADVTIEPDDSGEEPYMHMDAHFTFDVAFGRSPNPSALFLKPVVQAFNQMGATALTFLGAISNVAEPGISRPVALGAPDRSGPS